MRNAGLKKKNIIICGESFSYGTGEKHWPQIVAQKTNRNLNNLAIVGCSNYAICFQLQYALTFLKPDDLVIISLTAAERFEIDDDEHNVPASISDFRHNIDEITDSPYNKTPTITSGNLSSHLRNYHIERMQKYLMTSSYRLSAQYQAWCINYLLSKVQCKYLLYRNIFPRYHSNKEMYKEEYYFDLENYINSGPYDFETKQVSTTNHLSNNDNISFAKRVLDDYRINF